ncbi:MAG: signal peptidase I [bacterium]
MLASMASQQHKETPKESVKETIISVVIAFALAFVFRAFVAEAYVIPTGSMAPTLNGAHVRVHSPATGLDWAVGPIPGAYINNDAQNPVPEQGTFLRRQTERSKAPAEGLIVHDAVTGQRLVDPVGQIRAGDRIFVHKYLYALSEPQPWDVIVFKNPTDPDQNFIKRLIGLPNEEIAIVDGDIFFRPTSASTTSPASGLARWAEQGWHIRRKPARVQRSIWQRVYDSSYAPLPGHQVAGFTSPWVVAQGDIKVQEGGRWFILAGTTPATLEWDHDATFIPPVKGGLFDTGASRIDGTRELNDRYAYNESPDEYAARLRFPVGDLRVRFGLDLAGDSATLRLAPTITTRGHEMRALIENQAVRLQMRTVDPNAPAGEWTDLLPTPTPLPALRNGQLAEVEFWHVDQTLALDINGQRVAVAPYDWSPATRLANATRGDLIDKLAQNAPGNPLRIANLYRRSGARIEIAGTPATLRRVGIDRDLFYTPADYPPYPQGGRVAGKPALATSPASPLALGPDQFFTCGDNSPNSSDGRLWSTVDDWIATEIDPKLGVVDRRLLLGKAFFVYWPAVGSVGKVPVPDAGRMRFIQ